MLILVVSRRIGTPSLEGRALRPTPCGVTPPGGPDTDEAIKGHRYEGPVPGTDDARGRRAAMPGQHHSTLFATEVQEMSATGH